MAKRNFTPEFIREEILESDSCVHVESDTSYRHGSYETYVFEYEGKHWMFTVACHVHEGLEFWGDVECTEVEPHEVTTIEWRIVK
jgi:hypothetical protein